MKKVYIDSFIFGMLIYAEEAKKDPFPLGFIFNISNILDAPESDQGGIGLKLLAKKFNMRAMGDFYYSQESSTSSLSMAPGQ